jgi:hypothetical protein
MTGFFILLTNQKNYKLRITYPKTPGTTPSVFDGTNLSQFFVIFLIKNNI